MNNQPALSKSLKVYQIVFLGLAWMTPMIFFTVYGVAYDAAGGQMVLAYLIAFLAIFFTASSYSRMVKAYPIAGSAYTYTKKAIHSGTDPCFRDRDQNTFQTTSCRYCTGDWLFSFV